MNNLPVTKAINWSVFTENSTIQTVLTAAGVVNCDVFLVGGAVRDFLLTGRISEDLDFIVLNGSAERLAKYLSGALNRKCIVLDAGWGIFRIVTRDNITLDLANALNNNLDDDLKRRDLTVNAIALDLKVQRIIDPCAGYTHLQENVIAMVSAQTFQADPLRLLRVFRFAAQLNAKAITPETLEAVSQNKDRLWTVSGERIQTEFFKLLSITPCFSALKQLADCGLLDVLLPELVPMKAIEPSGFHHLNLYTHSLELVFQCERLMLDSLDSSDSKHQATQTVDEVALLGLKNWVSQPVGGCYSRLGLIKFACLLHDIGKPATKGSRPDPVYGERLTFYNHEKVGADMAQDILDRLKVSHEIRLLVTKLIRWHLYPCQFSSSSAERSLLRFYRKMGKDTLDLLLLAMADRYSTAGPWVSEETIQGAIKNYSWLINNYLALKPVIDLPPLLNGREIMSLLKMGPGPEIGTIINELKEAQLSGEIETAEEAKKWILAL
ncbi:MAG: HD domain-containing protein [Cyanobacteria bacterium P01_H01_bin.74]